MRRKKFKCRTRVRGCHNWRRLFGDGHRCQNRRVDCFNARQSGTFFCSISIVVFVWLTISCLARRRVQSFAALEADISRINSRNGGISFEYSQVTHDNVIVAHRKLDVADGKLDAVDALLDQANAKLDEANAKLDEANAKLDEANAKLDDLLCPFNSTGLNVTVLGQGCDAVDQDCDGIVDECEEDQVPPMVRLLHPPPEKPFPSIAAARTFVENNLDVSDDCAADLTVVVADPVDADMCTKECAFVVTATNEQCIGMTPPGVATGTATFVLSVDRDAPVITCGFFTSQDPHHVSADFDPCAGQSPPFPGPGESLHLDRECFEQDLVDVEFWFQIEVSLRFATALCCRPPLVDVLRSVPFRRVRGLRSSKTAAAFHVTHRRKNAMVFYPSRFACSATSLTDPISTTPRRSF
jgi:hypothetical protein